MTTPAQREFLQGRRNRVLDHITRHEYANELMNEQNADELEDATRTGVIAIETGENRVSANIHGNSKRPVSITVTRNPEDGTISVQSSRASEKSTTLPNPEKIGRVKNGEGTLGIRNTLALAWREKLVAEVIRKGELPNFLRAEMQHAAHRWTATLPRGQARKIRCMDLYAKLEDEVRSLLNPSAWKMAQDADGRVRVPRYNQAIRNIGVLEGLEQTNPGAVKWAASDTGMKQEEWDHPGQVITAVRSRMEKLGILRRNWKTVSKLPSETATQATGKHLPKYLSAVILNACGEAGEIPTTERMKQVTSFAASCKHASQAVQAPSKRDTEIQRQAREQLGRCLTLMFRSENCPIQETLALGQDMDQLADYVTYRIDLGETITATNWRGLVRASGRWHHEMRREEQLAALEAAAQGGAEWTSNWNSLIPGMDLRTDDGKTLTVAPLTSSRDLWKEAAQMGHCVGSYARHCVRGRSRIFSVSDESRTLATVEIALRNGTWQMAQVRATWNHPANDACISVARDLAREYRQAWENTPEEERHRIWTSNIRTGEIRVT